MPELSTGLLRAGLALKINHVKLALHSYLRDRTNHATGTAASYAVAAGLFAATGIFLLAACLVGIAALFRWVEMRYGLFPAFGIVGALLLVLAALCGAVASSRLRRRPPQFPSLGSRLRVAIKAGPIGRPSPVKPAPVEVARDRAKDTADTAAAILMAPSTPIAATGRKRRATGWRPIAGHRNAQIGLALTGILLGYAITRRRRQA